VAAWVGLDWVGLDWVGLDWAALCYTALLGSVGCSLRAEQSRAEEKRAIGSVGRERESVCENARENGRKTHSIENRRSSDSLTDWTGLDST